MGLLRLLGGMFFWLVFSSVFFGSEKKEAPFAGEDYVDMVDDIIARAVEKVSKEVGVDLLGNGGEMWDSVERVAIYFRFSQQVELEQAREIIVKVTEIFLNEFNSNKNIRPYLHNYPFTVNNLYLPVFFYKNGWENVDPGKIETARATQGTISYDIREPDVRECSDSYSASFDEFSEEALYAKIAARLQRDLAVVLPREPNSGETTVPYWKEETLEEAVRLVEEQKKQKALERKRDRWLFNENFITNCN